VKARFLIAARLVPSRLRNQNERRWLAGLSSPKARGYTLGSRFWFALQGTPVPESDAEAGAQNIAAGLQERYGSTTAVRWTTVDDSFSISAASLTGAAPMPEALASLLEQLT